MMKDPHRTGRLEARAYASRRERVALVQLARALASRRARFLKYGLYMPPWIVGGPALFLSGGLLLLAWRRGRGWTGAHLYDNNAENRHNSLNKRNAHLYDEGPPPYGPRLVQEIRQRGGDGWDEENSKNFRALEDWTTKTMQKWNADAKENHHRSRTYRHTLQRQNLKIVERKDTTKGTCCENVRKCSYELQMEKDKVLQKLRKLRTADGWATLRNFDQSPKQTRLILKSAKTDEQQTELCDEKNLQTFARPALFQKLRIFSWSMGPTGPRATPTPVRNKGSASLVQPGSSGRPRSHLLALRKPLFTQTIRIFNPFSPPPEQIYQFLGFPFPFLWNFL